MFTPQQKQEICMKVQDILRAVPNDELPNGEIQFVLHVDGAEWDSWANIRNASARSIPVPDVLVQNLSVS